MPKYIIAILIIGTVFVVEPGQSQSLFTHDQSGMWSTMNSNTNDDGDNEKSLLIRSFTFEVQSAWVEDFLMLGMLAKLDIYYPANITIRYSVDLRNGEMWFIPYIGATIPKVGGFEIGVKPRDAKIFTTPGWVTWRIFGGDERYFAISADILTNVPIGNIGFYNAGVQFRVRDDGSSVYIGFANYGHTQDETNIFGPAIKTSWALSEGSYLLVSGSYILSHPDDTYIRYTLSAGWRVVF